MKPSLEAEIQSVLLSMQEELSELQSEAGFMLQRYLFLQCRKKLGLPLVYHPRRFSLSHFPRPQRLLPLITETMEEYMRKKNCSLRRCVRKVAASLQISQEEVLQLWQQRNRS